MMERPPSGETPESKFAELMRTRPEDPETWSRFRDWCRQELAKDETARGQITLNLRIAAMYRAGGQLEAAWEELEGVRRQATQEGFEDLYDAAMAMMDDIDARGQ